LKNLSGAPLYGRLLASNTNTRLERLARDKHYTLLQKSVNYDRKKFTVQTTSVDVITLFPRQ